MNVGKESMILLTMKDIRREGDPILRKIAKEVKIPLTAEDQQTMLKMIEFLKNSQDSETAQKYNLRPGIGIAAPQIGVSKRMFAVHCEDESGKLLSMGVFNPVITTESEEIIYIPGGEGCLSVDRDVPGIVPRKDKVKVKGYDLDSNEFEIVLEGFLSIVFQHELDHLDGILFYDRIEDEAK
jgi:peptide deformylase